MHAYIPPVFYPPAVAAAAASGVVEAPTPGPDEQHSRAGRGRDGLIPIPNVYNISMAINWQHLYGFPVI